MSAFNINHFTPKGLIMWAHIFSPDSTGKYADGKYKTKLRLFGDDAQKMIELLESFIPEASAAEGGAEISVMPYAQALDKDKKPIAGAFDFNFKTKQKPTVIDSKKQRITKLADFKDGGILGEGVIAFKPHAWTVKRESGIGLYLQAVMIVERTGGGVDLSQFADYDEGFTIDTDSSPEEGSEDDIPDFASQ
jgi:hypothetical protein